MIYLFHGSDTGKTRSKAFAWVAAARMKAPEAPYIRLDADSITEDSLGSALSSQGLFFSRSLIILDDPLSDASTASVVFDLLPTLESSEHVVAIIAPKLTAAHLKKLEPKAAKVFEQTLTEKKVARGFNSSLVNALAARDRIALWKEILKAMRAGDAPEMVHGLLHWKARDLMQKGSRAWTQEETRALSRSLIELVSDARSGSLPLEMALERFALSL